MLRLIKRGAPAENAAAEALRALILETWKDIETDTHSDIWIITGVYLTGQTVEDLDLVLLAVFEQPREVAIYDNQGSVICTYLLGSLCAVIEVKGHRHGSAKIRNGALHVYYNGEEKNVTGQNRDQMHSLFKFLVASGAGRVHVTRFIWLPNVTTSELRQSSTNRDLPHEIILQDSTWWHVLFSIWKGWRGRHPEAQGFAKDRYFISADISRNTPADFNLISRVLTKEEMLLRAFSYSDLPQRQTKSPPRYRPGRSASRRGTKLSQKLVIGMMIVAVGLAAAIFAPRLILWTDQAELPAKSKEQLTSYAGRYRCQTNSQSYSITVADQDQRLQLRSPNGLSLLLQTAADEFKSVDSTNTFQGGVRFNRTPTGSVTRLVLIPMNGNKIICSKVA